MNSGEVQSSENASFGEMEKLDFMSGWKENIQKTYPEDKQ